jgi:hypothetical protein
MVFAGEGRVLHAGKTPASWQSEVVAETGLPIGKSASSWTAAFRKMRLKELAGPSSAI